MNRRKFLAMIAAGGVVTASGMWMPGQKLISIPKKPALYYDFRWGALQSKEVLRAWVNSRYEQLLMQGYTFVGTTLVRNNQPVYYGPSIQSLLSDNVAQN